MPRIIRGRTDVPVSPSERSLKAHREGIAVMYALSKTEAEPKNGGWGRRGTGESHILVKPA
eukprot:2519950-Rhodomonas_salina.4